jgi:phenylalanyl-tRNA synthetase alpha chain
MNTPDTPTGHIHPSTRMIEEINTIFKEMGFIVADGPEMEDEWHNFDALNFPKDHPARDMQDTFFLRGGKLMRTHTSNVQIRYMENHKAPFAIVSPGKVFRNEATDRTHEAQFFQFEALVVDKNITVANLRYYLETFIKKIFGEDIQIRLRPSFFPFVEPGFEVDMECGVCKGKGCPTCKSAGWIEILGAGLVHPNVLNAVGIDHREWSGLAFGVGVDRLIMMKSKLDDIRNLYTGDLRVIKQF